MQLHVDTTRIQEETCRAMKGKGLKKCFNAAHLITFALMKRTRGQMERKVFVLQFHFCLIVFLEHFKTQGKQSATQHDSFCHCVSFSRRTRCSVSSPQSRSLFPYSPCSCSPICCGRRSSTDCSDCVPVFKWLFFKLHLLLYLSVCLNVQRNCLLVSVF